MTLLIREGTRTTSYRNFRYLAVVVPLAIGLPIILLRLRSGVNSTALLMAASMFGFLLIVGLGSFAVQRFNTRTLLKKRGSEKFVLAHGNLARIERVLLGEHASDVSLSELKYERRILVLLDEDPVILESVVVDGAVASGGSLVLPDVAVVTIWHEGGKVNSVEITVDARSVLLEGRGKTPGWARN